MIINATHVPLMERLGKAVRVTDTPMSAPVVNRSKPSSKVTATFSCAKWMEIGTCMEQQQRLLGPLWYTGEVCILFADTNVGKSLLAVQIADMISRGGDAQGLLPDLEPEGGPRAVIYADFELSTVQFFKRYSTTEDGVCVKYPFGDNLYRMELTATINDIDEDVPRGEKLADKIFSDIEHMLTETGAKVVIIDNITFLADATENASDALPLMKRVKQLKNKYDISILLLAHTPKRSRFNPITRNDLMGSKMLINFADSAFAIGESVKSPQTRYIKQIKQRNDECIYNEDNVLECTLGKYGLMLGFKATGTSAEYEHLAQRDIKGRSADTPAAKRNVERKARAHELRKEGYTPAEIAGMMEAGLSTVYRLLED